MIALVSLLIFLNLCAFAELLPDEKKTVGTYVPNILLETHSGQKVKLKELADGKPLIINPIYTRCTSACPLMTEGLKRAISNLKESVKVISLTFDPRDTIYDLQRFHSVHKLPENWVVARSEQSEKLLRAIDFPYRYDKSLGEFDHPNLYVVLTPSGKISRYIYGVNPKIRDLQLSILEAKKEEARLSPLEGFLLRCFRYDPSRGTYDIDWFFIFDVLGGLLTFIVVPILVWGRNLYEFILKKS
ncbi:MAG: SCO family protein [Hydrogenobacter sp.]|uniref:Protein SCO1/2 n=1 Tax=Hydrogenobacter hydrogenophilus TaxID=35835 RepID=A0A285P601_9AQUI|nr:SCO family protein [Hydrogenobacter hydrogenophilus]SNZ16687.1 protein SCO1/2 [Hydrogenobacter hydrogenophilus]